MAEALKEPVWFEWNGGMCPIEDPKTRVRFKLRNGFIGEFTACALNWSHYHPLTKYAKHDLTHYYVLKDRG